jgi:hypothetical protein
VRDPLAVVKRGAAAVLVLAAASGCALFEGAEEEDLDFESLGVRFTDMYNESNRLTAELDAAEARIVQDCLEQQGFTLHDPAEFTSGAMPERDSFLMPGPHADFLPTVEEAERRGFWQWTELEGAEEYEDGALYAEWQVQLQASLEAVMTSEFAAAAMEAMAGAEGELGEFDLLPPEGKYAWYVAYAGDAWAAYQHPDLGGPGRETDAEGEDAYGSPPPGGCLGEMIGAVYGEIKAVENEEEGFTDWVSRPASPAGDWAAMSDRYTDRLAESETGSGFLDCLAERGSEGWEFRGDALPVHEYLSESGEGGQPVRNPGGDGGAWPDPPEETPDDLEGWLAFERELAVDFAECGDESGFRDAAEHAWEQAQLHYYLGIEGATYAWQEEMRGYLEKAQEVIGA